NHESPTGLFCLLAEALLVDEETIGPGRYENQIRILKRLPNYLKRDGSSSERSAERLCLLTVSPRNGYIADPSSFQCLHHQDSDLSRSQKKNAKVLQSSQGQLR